MWRFDSNISKIYEEPSDYGDKQITKSGLAEPLDLK